MKVAIELGHGAKPYDGGASGRDKEGCLRLEERLIRELAPWVTNELTRLGHNVNVIDIRNCKSVSDSLSQRTETANQWGADLYVSLHFNAYVPTDVPRGCEVCALGAIELADAVSRSISALGFVDRGGQRRKDLFVLKYTQMPAILIEPCFCDSTADLAILDDIKMQTLGLTIARSIDTNQDLIKS